MTVVQWSLVVGPQQARRRASSRAGWPLCRSPRRWNAGASALGSGPTALAKTRRPSSVVSRAATPGEKPVGCVTALTISLPSQRSTSLRTRRGRSVQSSLAPRSGGGCRSCIRVLVLRLVGSLQGCRETRPNLLNVAPNGVGGLGRGRHAVQVEATPPQVLRVAQDDGSSQILLHAVFRPATGGTSPAARSHPTCAWRARPRSTRGRRARSTSAGGPR